MRTLRVAVAAVVSAVAVAGCDVEPATYSVSGTVTFNKKPIPKGKIYFEPDSAKGNKGPQGSATITDGKYTTAVEGFGVRGGAYQIRILGFDGVARPDSDEPFGKGLFPEYTTTKDLPMQDSTADFDVPAKGK